MGRFIFVISCLLLAFGAWWFFWGGSGANKNQESVMPLVEENPPVGEPNAEPIPTKEPEVVVQTPEVDDDTPEPYTVLPGTEKQLTPEEEAFLMDTDEWQNATILLMQDANALYKLLAADEQEEAKKIDLEARYQSVKELTDALSFPSEFEDVLAAIQSFETTLARSMDKLSSAPTLQELEAFFINNRSLTNDVNIINGARNRVRY